MRRALFLLLAAVSSDLYAQCAPPYLVQWPSAANPVWRLCWLSPDQSSGPDGSGLELRHVFYKGRRVFWRANMPVLNVQYDPGSGFCGPTYRDWLNQLAVFDANNVLQPGYAEPTTNPKTTCDTPGTDVGSFHGVAVQKLNDRLILTTNTQAGWYRYIQQWTLYKDGRITPMFGFTAVSNTCVNKPHDHHGYWRFDFDIDGFPQDRIDERNPWWFFWTKWSTLQTEQRRNRTSGNNRWWRIMDHSRGYVVKPGTHDIPANSFAGADVWALRYHFNEADDGGRTSGSMADAQHIDPFLTGESIVGTDVVLWYRIGHRHEQGLACMMVGPTLLPVGNW